MENVLTKILMISLVAAALVTPALAGPRGHAAEKNEAAIPAHPRDREQQEKDCALDAMSLCASEIPDEKKIEACLVSHHETLSAACASWFRK